jgi:hypothetical protein
MAGQKAEVRLQILDCKSQILEFEMGRLLRRAPSSTSSTQLKSAIYNLKSAIRITSEFYLLTSAFPILLLTSAFVYDRLIMCNASTLSSPWSA